MTRRTIGSVMDDINEWQGPNGTVYYVTAFTTNNEVISAGKKDMDAALEVRGLLQEVIEVPQEFILEPKGNTKKGNPKWNLRAFGPPEGVWTYNTIKGAAPDIQGDAAGPVPVAPVKPGGIGRPPEHSIDASIRASVALKAAATAFRGEDVSELLGLAEKLDQWLAKKAAPGVTKKVSGEALPTPEETDEGAGQGEGPAPSSTNWTERVKEWPTDE